MGFKLGSEKRGIKTFKGAPVFKKNMGAGILAEANKDGTIFVHPDLDENSQLYAETMNHEHKHLEDMCDGKLDYNDDYVRWKGQTVPRKDICVVDSVKWNGVWREVGSDELPWEQDAFRAENRG